MIPLTLILKVFFLSRKIIGLDTFDVVFTELTRIKMSDPRIKQITVKTGVLKRVGKEKLSYRCY